MKRVADRLVLDTNVLLAATDEARDEHAAALEALESWPLAGTVLYTSGQVLREYLAVATRPVALNGLGLTRVDAVANVEVLRERLRFLEEDQRVATRLAELVRESECAGKQVHDANVVATALVHGVAAIATLNVEGFARFDSVIRIVDPRVVAR